MDDEKLTRALERLEPARLPTRARDGLREKMREAFEEDRPHFPPCAAPKPPARSRLRILKRLAAALLLVAVVLAGSFVAVGAVAGARLTDEIDRIRAAGEPLTLEEILPPPIPDEDNAAIPLMQALERLEVPSWRQDPASRRDPLFDVLKDPFGATEEAVAEVEAWIASNREARALLHEALRRPGCRFPHVASESETRASMHYFDRVELARMVAAEARLALRRDRGDEALDGAAKLLALGRFTGSLRFLMAHLVRITNVDLAVETIRQAMPRMPVPGPGYPALLEALGQIDALATARRSMLTERAFAHARHEEFRRHPDRRAEMLGLDEDDLLRIPLRLIPGGVLRLDHARELEIWSRMVDAAGRPAYEAKQTWADLESDAGELPWYCVLSRNRAVLKLSHLFGEFSSHQSRVDLARLAIALRMHEARHGALPDSLSGIDRDLLDSAPIDPWSGEPYRYAPGDDGSFLLYGVGQNDRDDGGDDREDLVWRGAATK